MNKVTAFVAIASLAACPFVSTVTCAMPLQGTPSSASKTPAESDFRDRPESDKLTRNTTLARNTTTKTETIPGTGSVKEQKTDDKKTIGRCWKRLMNMAREINHAHQSKSKSK